MFQSIVSADFVLSEEPVATTRILCTTVFDFFRTVGSGQ
jgi:hypothetical protein